MKMQYWLECVELQRHFPKSYLRNNEDSFVDIYWALKCSKWMRNANNSRLDIEKKSSFVCYAILRAFLNPMVLPTMIFASKAASLWRIILALTFPYRNVNLCTKTNSVYFSFLYVFSHFVVWPFHLLDNSPYFNRVDCDENGKPSHLANSAVLKLLEEEERQKQTGGKFIIISIIHSISFRLYPL